MDSPQAREALAADQPILESPVLEGPALSWRAIAVGMGIGIFLSIANLYMLLKIGWSESGNITATVVGFALFRVFARRSPKYTPWENHLTQSTAVCAGMMPLTGGLVTTVSAMQLSGHSMSSWGLIVWGLLVGAASILIAVPLRQTLIVEQQLPFPTGIAVHELLGSLHSVSAKALSSARRILISLTASATWAWFRDGRPSVLPGALMLPGKDAQSFSWGLALSPLLVSMGAMVGPRVGLSLLSGAVGAWVVAAPILVSQGTVASSDFATVVSWLMWPGLGLMAGAGIVSLGQSLWVQFKSPSGGSVTLGRTWGMAMLALCAALVALAWWLFSVPVWIGACAIVLSALSALVISRAGGLTDVAPSGAMAQLSQVAWGVMAPGQLPANLGASGMVGGFASGASNMLWCLKTGYLMRGPLVPQFCGSLAGVVIGTLVSVGGFRLLTTAYPLGGEQLPAVSAVLSKGLAELVTGTAQSLPPGAFIAFVVSLVLGAVLALAETKWPAYAPSPVGVGMGFLVPATYGVALSLGGLLNMVIRTIKGAEAEDWISSAATGGIAGEAFVGVVVAALVAFGG